MRIGLKLTLAFLAIASLVGAVGYLAGTTSREVEYQMERLSRSAVIKADTTDLLRALYAGQLAAHALVDIERKRTTIDEGAALRKQELLDLIRDSIARAEHGLDRQRSSIERSMPPAAGREAAALNSAPLLRSIEQLQQLLASHRQLMDEFLRIAGDSPEKAEAFLEGQVSPHFENELLPPISMHRDGAEAEFTRGIRSTQRAMVLADQQRGLMTVVAATAAVLLGLTISRSIGRRLAMLQEAAMKMGRGQLGTRVPVRSRDEIGMLANSLNGMAADLEERTVSRNYLNNVIRSMREMLIVTDPGLRIRQMNPAVCDELGFATEELIGRPLADILDSNDIGLNALLTENTALDIECLLTGKSDRRIPVHCLIAGMRDESGRLEGVVCAAMDVSRQKADESRLLDSLHEKELLLKELHHRVKNNLQVISSLLNLQSQEIDDPQIIRFLQESQARIRSMALVHEQFYRSANLASIEFPAYVKQLVTRLQHSFVGSDNRLSITVEGTLPPLPLDLAIPCGMIINELVSNAMEHAFPDDRKGSIRVLFGEEEETCRLEVADDGVGMAEGPQNERANSLGMRVVIALARQIRGTLETCQANGTGFVLRFPRPENLPSGESAPA